MGIIEAIILGIVQGLTEFLPISSTAHVRIVPAIFGWDDPGAAFTAVIQLGTLIAVLIYFRKDLIDAVVGWVKSIVDPGRRNTYESRMGWAIFIGTIPIVIFGTLFKHRIENDLRSLHVIASSLIGMGLLLLLAERVGTKQRDVGRVTVGDGLLVGLFQAIALIPGASRSGSTITGGLFAGFDRASAARFSFLLSVPSVFAAAIFSLKEHAHAFQGDLLVPAIVANIAALISGYAAIAFLISYLQKHGTVVFVVYRVLLGLVLFGLLFTGVLSPDQGLPTKPDISAAQK
ncbi:MAG: undecaprenyl-diphosphate phosphatase [Fimbriimonadaceae bacterium]|nr:undecaprenyl-diphosphate phosphatase [Fimbriimonadaceae bacterium]